MVGGIKDSSLPESSKQIKYSHIKQMQASRRTGRIYGVEIHKLGMLCDFGMSQTKDDQCQQSLRHFWLQNDGARPHSSSLVNLAIRFLLAFILVLPGFYQSFHLYS